MSVSQKCHAGSSSSSTGGGRAGGWCLGSNQAMFSAAAPVHMSEYESLNQQECSLVAVSFSHSVPSPFAVELVVVTMSDYTDTWAVVSDAWA